MWLSLIPVCSLQQDRVVIRSVENHPMAAGFNNVSVSMSCIFIFILIYFARINPVIEVLQCYTVFDH